MHEYLRELPRCAVVLDLGSSLGSFDSRLYEFTTILVDLEPPNLLRNPRSLDVCADMACLPMRSRCADAVICNHSLEHVLNLDAALTEIGRVSKEGGFLFVAVPDAATLCDQLYRWLAREGGHVNHFTSATDLASKIERLTGLQHCGTRPLFTSFSYLNRKNRRAKAPRKMLMLGGGNERFLLIGTGILRLLDRIFRARLTRYGWALYFGRGHGASMEPGWRNVCIRCGAGHPSAALLSSNRVNRHLFGLKTYACPACDTLNFFSND